MSLVEFCCHFSCGRCRRDVQLRFDHVLFFFLRLLLSPNIEKCNAIISRMYIRFVRDLASVNVMHLQHEKIHNHNTMTIKDLLH